MTDTTQPGGTIDVATPYTLDDAVDLITDELRPHTPLAGGTWIMRAPLRGEDFAHRYADLGAVGSLTEIDWHEGGLRIGAMVTHDGLGRIVASVPQLRGLATAALTSANPGVRNIATIGGNIAATQFRCPDVTTALLSLRANVNIRTHSSRDAKLIPLHAFLESPSGGRHLITGAEFPLPSGPSAHLRLPLRAAGDYPAVICSVSTEVGRDGRMASATISYGALSGRPMRWRALEAAVNVHGFDPEFAEREARVLAPALTASDSPGVPADYRRGVLPSLIGRAFADCHSQMKGAPWFTTSS